MAKYWYIFPCGVNEKSVGDAIINIFTQFYNDSSIEITLYISSTGGDIDSAIRFYDFIKSAKIKLKTVGFGQVDSAAVLLLLSGTERTLIKDCRVRLHLPTYSGQQQSQVISVHVETLSLLQKLDKRYFEIMSLELGKKEDDLRKLLTDGRVLDTKEALELKIVARVEDQLPVNK